MQHCLSVTYHFFCELDQNASSVCVRFLPPLSISRPPLLPSSSELTNSMKEVIIGRSRALPGGTTCIWIQALALSRSQDLSLVYCISATRSLTFLRYILSLYVSHSLVHDAQSSDCIIITTAQSFMTIFIVYFLNNSAQPFLFTNCESSTVYSLQYN